MPTVTPGGRPRSAAYWNHHESSAGITDFQSPRDSDIAHDGMEIPAIARGPIEVPGAINNQRLAVLLKHLLFRNGDSGGVATTVVPGRGHPRRREFAHRSAASN